MKRILALAVSVIMILPLVACATQTAGSFEEVAQSGILVADDLMKTGAAGMEYSKIFASDDAFIRTGSFADQCQNESRVANGSLAMKKASEDYGRDILIRFDLDPSLSTWKNRATLALTVTWADQVDGKPNPILVYGISSDWSSDSVTYNNAPKYSEEDLVGIGYPEKTGVCTIDVTDYVIEALDNGEPTVSFRLTQQYATSSETGIVSITNADTTRHPSLLLEYWEEGQTYSYALLENAEENEAIWEYAQEMYDDWYKRYQEILASDDFEAERIQSNLADYTVKTVAHNRTPSWKPVTQKTRLVSTLSGYTPEQREENLYGGDLSAPRQEATGRYYTKRIDGRWWIIDPLGYPCYVRGINHLNFSYQNNSPYQKASMAKAYGSAEKWAIAATRWLRDDYHINVYQTGHASLDGVENGMSRIIAANGVTGYAIRNDLLAEGEAVRVKYNNILPVFDPAFAEYADERVRTEIAPYKDDMTQIFGYTSDNEIAFSNTFLTQYLTLDYTIPAVAYSYAVAWNWYKNMTGEEYPRVEDIDMYSKKLGVDLQDLFLGFVYDRYYKVMSNAIKSHDPAALYLGVRGVTATTTSEWYLRFTGYWCDVYCVNYYEYWEADAETLYNVSRLTGKPMLVTEFYAKGMDAESPLGGSYPNTDGWGWVVKTQTDRGHFYQNFCLRLLESKNCIGWLYFQYIDNDPGVNPSASNKGMVNCDLDTEVYDAFNRQMALVNQNVYSLIDFFDEK